MFQSEDFSAIKRSSELTIVLVLMVTTAMLLATEEVTVAEPQLKFII